MIIAAFCLCSLLPEKASIRAGNFAAELFPGPATGCHSVESKTGSAFKPDTK